MRCRWRCVITLIKIMYCQFSTNFHKFPQISTNFRQFPKRNFTKLYHFLFGRRHWLLPTPQRQLLLAHVHVVRVAVWVLCNGRRLHQRTLAWHEKNGTGRVRVRVKRYKSCNPEDNLYTPALTLTVTLALTLTLGGREGGMPPPHRHTHIHIHINSSQYPSRFSGE